MIAPTLKFPSNATFSTATTDFKFGGNKDFSPYLNKNGNLGYTGRQWDSIYVDKINNGSNINIPNIAGTMAIQASSLPTAAASYEGQIYQYAGTTDANYTNRYFYQCVSDGASTPTYSWARVDVQPNPDPLPSQAGNTGKFLTTNGTNASWATVDALPSQTGQSGKFLTTDGTTASWDSVPSGSTVTFVEW